MDKSNFLQKLMRKIFSIPVIVTIIIITVILYYFSPSLFVSIFLVSIAIPVILAYKITIIAYRYSGYLDIVEDRIYRKEEVGLAYIRSFDTKKILLRKQTEEPFVGMWVFLGGYLRKDETVKETIERRVSKLTDGTLKIKCQDKIAETNGDPDYMAYIISTGYVPAHDRLYEVKKVFEEKDGKDKLITLSEIKEEDVKETPVLRWWSTIEVKEHEEVFGTMKDIVRALQEDKEGYIKLSKYWKIDEEYLKKHR